MKHLTHLQRKVKTFLDQNTTLTPDGNHLVYTGPRQFHIDGIRFSGNAAAFFVYTGNRYVGDDKVIVNQSDIKNCIDPECLAVMTRVEAMRYYHTRPHDKRGDKMRAKKARRKAEAEAEGEAAIRQAPAGAKPPAHKSQRHHVVIEIVLRVDER